MDNPFFYSDTNKRYHTWDYHLRQKFGGKVFKVSLDGGFSCPNIDGTRGMGGCTYCDYSFKPHSTADLLTQFQEGCAMLHKKWPQAAQYIPYFQTNTNTYAPLQQLRSKYEAMLAQPGVVGLAIATRADALPDEVVDYLAELARRTYLIVELGLQTAHDSTAARINRGHSMAEFLNGYNRLAERGINICVHIIDGLPGEDHSMMLDTVRQIAPLGLHSIKIHLLHILRGTKMAEQYAAGEIQLLTREQYVNIVCDQLELLPPQVIVQRVTGDGLRETLIEPQWSLRKFVVMNEIDKELLRRNSWQGKRAAN